MAALVLAAGAYFWIDAGRTVKIDGLPPGDYTLVAWHEEFGEQEAEVTVDSSGTAVAEFSFQEEDDE